MKQLDELLSKLTYIIILALVALMVFIRPVQMNSQAAANPPALSETPLIWWPVDNIKLYIGFAVVMAALMFYRRVFLTQWPGRHIVTVSIAILATIFTYSKTIDSYVAGFSDRIEIVQPLLFGKDVEVVPVRRIAEVRLSCTYTTLRGRVTAEPTYTLRLSDGRELNLFSSFKSNNRAEVIAGISRIDQVLRKSGAERLAAEQDGPDTPTFQNCMNEMKSRLPADSYDLLTQFMVKTADKSTYLRTL